MLHNIRPQLALIGAFVLVVISQPSAWSHPKFSVVNQLITICSAAGDSASSRFVNDTTLHATALQLVGTGMATAKGASSFINTKFQTVSVLFKGDCFASLVPASLIVRIKFIKPGTTVVLDHGYNCAKNIVDVLPNGLTHMLITTNSVCDCDDMIPPGSTLIGVDCDLFCADPDSSVKHKEMIYSLVVNGQSVPFDLTSHSASCGF
jgi:hypothetical protein